MAALFRVLSPRALESDSQPQSKPASKTIKKQQRDVIHSLPFNQTEDFENVKRGFIGRLEPNYVKEGDKYLWNNDAYAFLNPTSPKIDGPDTANPSLWRQSKLNAFDGLFEVTPDIYQVRGWDVSNVTFVEGKEGVIVIDPLTSQETGAKAWELYKKYRGDKRKIKAVIYTHTHVDHFGGVRAFISEQDLDNGVKVIAPENFLEHAVSENVYAGTAMARRAGYMYGAALPRGPTGQIGAGLAQTVSGGTVTLIKPNDYITKTGEIRVIDSVDMRFQMAPGTEAPAEMLVYFPQFSAVCTAEDANHTFHNILTLRGAVVRDAHVWSNVLTEVIDLFGGRAEVLFSSHQWPTWGFDKVVELLTLQRDLYAFVHDQTLRLINQGMNGAEIAEELKLPPALDQAWHTRGYYGSLSHNIKAIYQRYIGWFDGNPAHLWEHIPVEKAKRYVKLAGGIDNIIQAGKAALEGGDFRWAAEVLNHAVFAHPDNKTAKELLADTYEQLGYGAENGTWRDFYLSGTYELRNKNFGTPTKTASNDIIAHLPPDMLFDSFAIQIDGTRSYKEKFSIKIALTDGPRYLWWLSNGALIYKKTAQETIADVTLTTTTDKLNNIVKGLDPKQLEENGIRVTGDVGVLKRLSNLLLKGDSSFNIVTP